MLAGDKFGLACECHVHIRMSSQKYRPNQIMKAPVVLVPGASRGIGRAIAQKLVQAGFQVFGTTRQASPVGMVARELHLNIQEEESVERCVNAVLAQLEESISKSTTLGSAYRAIEEVSLAQIKAVFETNFFGVVWMTQTVLPTMRRQASGRDINIGSLAGFLPMPYKPPMPRASMRLPAGPKH